MVKPRSCPAGRWQGTRRPCPGLSGAAARHRTGSGLRPSGARPVGDRGHGSGYHRLFSPVRLHSLRLCLDELATARRAGELTDAAYAHRLPGTGVGAREMVGRAKAEGPHLWLGVPGITSRAPQKLISLC